MTLILREGDVKQVLDMDAVIGAVESSMRELGEGTAQNEPRRRAFAPGGLLNVMFASYPGGGYTGLKAYTIGGGKVRFLIRELRAFGRDPVRRAAFAEDRRAALGLHVVASESAEAAVRAADIVVVMTTSSQPVLEADWVAPHALVIAAGSNFPNRVEIPAELVARARSVVVDQLATARLESGDLIQAHAAGMFDWERATELASVLTGKWKMPEEPGITLFESHGLAIWDLAAASVVVPAARAKALGEEVAFFG